MRYLILISLLSLGIANAAERGTEEKLLGYQPRQTGIIFQVHSGGCTLAEDFITEVKRSNSGVTEIKLIRIRPDPCLSFVPTGIRFKLSNDEIGIENGEAYTITNSNGVVHSWIWTQ